MKAPKSRSSAESDVVAAAWSVAMFGELLADIQPGFACGAHSRGGDGVPHLRPMNVSTDGQITLDDLKLVPRATADDAGKWIERGDVLFNNTNSPELVGKTAYYDLPEPRAFSNHMTRLRVYPERIDPRYCAVWLHQLWRDGEFARQCNNHVSQASISREVLRELEIPLPPLPEQKRIVEAIERLTARVGAARDRLANVPAILKRFRQAVLAVACSGRLTEDWREANGQEGGAADLLRLTESVRSKEGRIPRVAGVPDDLDAPAGWSPAYFGNLLTLLTSGSRGWAEFYSDTGPLFIRSQDINTDALVLADMAHVDPPQSADRARTRAKRYDVLLTITGANVTKCAHISADLPEAYVSQHVALCRLAVPELSPFVHLWLTSPQHGRKVLLDNAYGAGKPGLNLDNIKEVPVALPSLSEQAEIVRRVDSLMKLANTIEHRVAAAQARSDKLTQSILAKAFRGELVTSDPDGTTDTKVCDLRATSHKYEVSDQANGRKGPTPRVREGRAIRAKSR
jgi:type I restriction enzyme, S subunit